MKSDVKQSLIKKCSIIDTYAKKINDRRIFIDYFAILLYYIYCGIVFLYAISILQIEGEL